METTKRNYIVALYFGGYLGLIDTPHGRMLDRVNVRLFARRFTKKAADEVAKHYLGARVEEYSYD